MNNKKIAVIFGGNSTEYDVSLQSAFAVLENLNTEKYDIIPIGITREGNWYHYIGDYNNIQNNTWFERDTDIIPVIVSQNRVKNGIIEFLISDAVSQNHIPNSAIESCENDIKYTKLDFVFPILHGKNGEDGTVQGYLNWQVYRLLDVVLFLQHYVWTKTNHINLFIQKVLKYQNQYY